MATPFEIEGSYKNTTANGGDANFWYGGGNFAYASLSAALLGTPAVKRQGLTVGVVVGGIVTEYWWPTSAVADSDLVPKGAALPQPLGTGDSPTFASLTITGDVITGGILKTEAINYPLNQAGVVFQFKLTNVSGGSNTVIFRSQSTADAGSAGSAIDLPYNKSGTLALLSDIAEIANSFLPLNGSIPMTGLLTLSGDPLNANNPATKSYVDNLFTGITWKQEVKVATTADITLSGTQSIDGKAVVAGDRALVKNQTNATENGIYAVSADAWTRTADADTGAEIGTAAVLVRFGTTNKNTQWTCTNSTDPVIGTDDISFGQISGAGTYTNGDGILLSGNVFSIDNTYTGFDGRYLQPGTAASTYLALSGGTIFGQLSFSGGGMPHIYGNGSFLTLSSNGNWNSAASALIQLDPVNMNLWSNGGSFYFNNSAGEHIAIIDSTTGKIQASGFIAGGSSGQALTADGGMLTLGSGATNDWTRLQSTTHAGTFWVQNAWDGTYWQLASNHPSPVNVGRANVAGALEGFSISGRGNTDLNSITYNSISANDASSNNRPADYVSLLALNNGDVGLQIAGGYTSDNLFFRGWGSSGASFTPWRTVVHNGNFASYGLAKSGDSTDGIYHFRSNKGGGATIVNTDTYGLEAYSDDGGPAGMSFHRGGYYALNMGLDSDNVFRLGGWSASGVTRLFSDAAGNFGVAGSVSANGVIEAPGASGFQSATYVVDSRNPIWRFGNADPYGLSYFQGTSGFGGTDSLGIHFGTPTGAGSTFVFRSNGDFITAGSASVNAIVAPGGLNLNNNCGIYQGGGDNATYSEYNLAISSWFGIGFKCNLDAITRIVFDTRTGNASFMGNVYAGAFIKSGGTYNQLLQADGNTIYYDSGASGNNIVQRNSDGHIFASYFNTSAGLEPDSYGMTRMYGSADGYIRPVSANSVKSFLQSASGNWDININGSAGIAGSAGWAPSLGLVDAGNIHNPVVTYSDRSTASQPQQYQFGTFWEFKNGSVLGGATGNYMGLMTLAPWMSTTGSTGDPAYQLAFCSTAANGNMPRLSIRNGIDTSWNSWHEILHEGNVSSYAFPVTGGTFTGSVGVNGSLTVKGSGAALIIEDPADPSYYYSLYNDSGNTLHLDNSDTGQIFTVGSGGDLNVVALTAGNLQVQANSIVLATGSHSMSLGRAGGANATMGVFFPQGSTTEYVAYQSYVTSLGYVPYSGATTNLNIGGNYLYAGGIVSSGDINASGHTITGKTELSSDYSGKMASTKFVRDAIITIPAGPTAVFAIDYSGLQRTAINENYHTEPDVATYFTFGGVLHVVNMGSFDGDFCAIWLQLTYTDPEGNAHTLKLSMRLDSAADAYASDEVNAWQGSTAQNGNITGGYNIIPVEFMAQGDSDITITTSFQDSTDIIYNIHCTLTSLRKKEILI